MAPCSCIFGTHAKNARERRAKEKDEKDKLVGKEDTFSNIDVDLTRTFPSLAFFQEECSMNEQLKNILETYVFYRPDVGYVQGMSYLAGNCLLYMEPYMAFVCLANLLNSPFFHVFLKLEPEKMNLRYKIFSGLFADYLPALYEHFENQNLGPDLFFMEWCMTLFCKRLALDVVGRIWDCYMVFGEEFVYRTAVGILSVLNSELLDKPFEKCVKLLHAQPQELTETQLFDAIASIKISDSLRDKISQLQVIS